MVQELKPAAGFFEAGNIRPASPISYPARIAFRQSADGGEMSLGVQARGSRFPAAVPNVKIRRAKSGRF